MAVSGSITYKSPLMFAQNTCSYSECSQLLISPSGHLFGKAREGIFLVTVGQFHFLWVQLQQIGERSRKK
jgi:hypothetical protein